MSAIIVRNKELLNKEILIDQVIADQKKHVKTEKLIEKIPRERKDKQKKSSMLEVKTIPNLNKIRPYEKGKDSIIENRPSMIRSNSSQKKETSKIFVPTLKKPTKFY